TFEEKKPLATLHQNICDELFRIVSNFCFRAWDILDAVVSQQSAKNWSCVSVNSLKRKNLPKGIFGCAQNLLLGSPEHSLLSKVSGTSRVGCVVELPTKLEPASLSS